MSSVPIHLILAANDSQSRDDLKTAFIPLNGAFDLRLVLDENQFNAEIVKGVQIAVFAGNSDGLSWQECARRIRHINHDAWFILISNEESITNAITQGADLLLGHNDVQNLPVLIGSFLKRNNHKKSKVAEVEEARVTTITSDEINELHLKNKELEKINFELDRFVYSASHDLRAPLTSVLGLLYLLRKDVKDEESQRLVDLMEESILKLDKTIRDIVAYSRNNRTDVLIEPLRIETVMEEVISGLAYLEGNDIQLKECVKWEDEGVFLGDRSRLLIILNNLISNAIKYRHPARKPEVIIKAQREEKSLILVVADNGIGINEQHLSRIFEMFYRTSDHSSGSGLGLYIVKETVKKLDGQIEVNSKVNEGSVFKITLPLLKDVRLNSISNEAN